MDNLDFYNDTKFCPTCDGYVRYLMSVEHSYCADCGGRVRLFSDADWKTFHEGLAARRPKGGRPKKNKRESA